MAKQILLSIYFKKFAGLGKEIAYGKAIIAT